MKNIPLIFDYVLLDLYVQCMVAQAAFRVQGRVQVVLQALTVRDYLNYRR